MPLKTVQRIEGLSPEAERQVLSLVNSLIGEVNRLSAGSSVSSLRSGGTLAREGQVLRVKGGSRVTLPRARQENQGAEVSVLLETPGELLVDAVDGTVNGGALFRTSTLGKYSWTSNGSGGWHGTTVGASETAAAEATARTIPTPTWAQVLNAGNSSETSNAVMGPGTRLIVPGGQAATTGDIASDADISIDAATDIHMHAGGIIHVGHAGQADAVHLEADGEIELGAGTNVLVQAATTIAEQAGGDWSAASVGGSTTLNASTFVRLITGGVVRYTLEADGSWNIGGSNGTAGQYVRSFGGAAPPQWSTISIADFGDIGANTFLGNITGASAPVTANSLSALAGNGLSYAAGIISVGAGTGIAVDASNVALATVAAETFFGNFTAGVAAPAARAGSSVAGAGLTYTAGGTLAVGAGTSMQANANDLQYIGNAAEILNSTATGNLGTIDISTLTCGGTYRISAASSAFSIEGFTAKPQGFWFVFLYQDTADTCTLFHEDATATATNRLALPGARDIAGVSGFQLTSGVFFYTGSRWQWLAASPVHIGGGGNYVAASSAGIDATGTSVALTSSSGNTTITANGSVSIDAGSIAIINTGANSPLALTSDGGGGFLRMAEDSASDPSMGAGEGMYWVHNDAPCRPYFTDDTNVDHEIALVSATTRILEVRYADVADAAITETPTAAATWFEAEGIGGGGGGGGADADTANEACAGAGGSSGAWFRVRLAIVSGNITGVIGAGGTAGSNTGGNGGDGTATTLTYNGVTYTAGPGNGGTGVSAGATGNGQLQISAPGGYAAGDATADESAGGSPGEHGLMFSSSTAANQAAKGGNGGNSKLGGGGRGGTANGALASSAGLDGNAPGAGGGGAARTANAASTGVPGGAGAAGMMKITFYSGTMPTEATIN